MIVDFFESNIFFDEDKEEDLATIEIIDQAIVIAVDNSNKLVLLRKIIVIGQDSLDHLPDKDERKNKILFAILEAANKNYYDIDIPIKSDIKFKINLQTKKIERLKKVEELKIKGIVIAVISEKLLYDKENFRYF